MKNETLALLCHPETKEPLQFVTENGEDFLFCEQTNEKFEFKNTIPVFINKNQITGSNQKYRKMYDEIAFSYDFVAKVAHFIYPDLKKGHRQLLKELGVKKGDKVLEVSIGTGANLGIALNSNIFSKNISHYGLDISSGMLKKCQKNLKKWGMEAELFLGEAENLPFKDNSFDVVWHSGGINFFNDKAKAIQEMIRVAKPKTKIVIIDETEKVAKGNYEKTPFVRKFFKGREENITMPIDLVPAGMLDISEKLMLKDRVYVITFIKP